VSIPHYVINIISLTPIHVPPSRGGRPGHASPSRSGGSSPRRSLYTSSSAIYHFVSPQPAKQTHPALPEGEINLRPKPRHWITSTPFPRGSTGTRLTVPVGGICSAQRAACQWIRSCGNRSSGIQNAQSRPTLPSLKEGQRNVPHAVEFVPPSQGGRPGHVPPSRSGGSALRANVDSLFCMAIADRLVPPSQGGRRDILHRPGGGICSAQRATCQWISSCGNRSSEIQNAQSRPTLPSLREGQRNVPHAVEFVPPSQGGRPGHVPPSRSGGSVLPSAQLASGLAVVETDPPESKTRKADPPCPPSGRDNRHKEIYL
jgi:hypothetical protein